MQRNTRAYTLIEFLVTLTVLSILALIVIPGFYAFAQKQELRNAAQQIAFDLQLAKSHAIKTSRPVLVNFLSGNKSWCYSLRLDNVGDENVPVTTCENDNNIIKTNTAKNYREIELINANFAGGDGYIGFDPIRGMPVARGKARNGSIWLRNRFGQRMAVVVNRIGRVRVCEAGKDGCPQPPA